MENFLFGELAGPGNAPALRRGSRGQFEAFVEDPSFPAHIRESIKAQQLRGADTSVFSIKRINSNKVDMFEAKDSKEDGIRNIDRGKLAKDQVMVLSEIEFGVAYEEVGNSPSDQVVRDAIIDGRYFPLFSNVPLVKHYHKATTTGLLTEISEGTAVNAELTTIQGLDEEMWRSLETATITVTNGGKAIIQDYPLYRAKRYGGVIRLDNPRLILPDTDVKAEIRFGNEPEVEDGWAMLLGIFLNGTGTIF